MCSTLWSMSKTPKTSIVAVVWRDAHDDGVSGWTTAFDISPDPYVVLSLGVLLPKETKSGHVSIARSVSEDEFLDHVIHIPDGMVESITVLGCVEDHITQG